MEDKYSNAHNETTQRGALDGKQEVVRYAETNEHSQPQVHFDPAEERRIVRKIDCYIVPLVSLLYLFCFIDRTNIGNARLANLEKDLNLRGYDFNLVLSVFYISYALFEIPTTMACKWIGPGWFIPGTTLGFGILTIAFAFVTNRASACGVRFLLGIFEAGMLPGIAYYLSRWYRRAELSLRLATYLVMAPLAGAFGGLLASGILSLSAFGSTHTWQMIFAIEGIITIGLALLAFLFLTDRPETARWLTESEKRIAIARIKSERIGATKLLDKIDTTKLLRGILNPVTIVTACIFFLLCIFVQGFAFFAPTIIRTIYPTRSVVYQQIMTVPPYLVGSVFALLTGWLSTKTDRRNIFLVLSPLPVVIGYSIFLAIENARVRYGALFIIVVGAFNGAAFCFALVAANVVSDTARSSAIGFTVMWGNIGGLVATWTFLPFDGPNYPIGNGINLAAQGTASLLALGLGFWMVRDNKRRKGNDVDALLGNMDEKEIEDLDWHHPGFVWRS